jgi:hypothetical protein
MNREQRIAELEQKSHKLKASLWLIGLGILGMISTLILYSMFGVIGVLLYNVFLYLLWQCTKTRRIK